MTATPRTWRGLYAITGSHRDDGELLAWADAVLSGGAVWLQYRDKLAGPVLRRRRAARLADLCRNHGALFWINDDVDLARAVGADGVHLGRDDGDPVAARHRLGASVRIGVSCYDDPARAAALAAAGADYLAFGAFFASASKPGAPRASPSALAQARALGRPVVAIGGITPDNGASLLRAGADLLAVIAGLAGPPEVAARAAARYAALFATDPTPEPP